MKCKARLWKTDYWFSPPFKINIIQTVVPTAANAATQAAMARILSSVLTVGAPTATGAGRCAATGAAPRCGCTGAATGAAVLRRGGIPPEAPVGPPGGNVGNLIVGAALGFGGKLMRTVSFLG